MTLQLSEQPLLLHYSVKNWETYIYIYQFHLQYWLDMFVHISVIIKCADYAKYIELSDEFGSVQWVIEYTGPTVHCDPNNFCKDWEVTGNALDNSLHFLVSPNEEQLQTLGGQPWLHQLSFLSLYFPEKKIRLYGVFLFKFFHSHHIFTHVCDKRVCSQGWRTLGSTN